MTLCPPVTATLDEQLRAIREGCAVRELKELAVLEVQGRDRATWLNGLVTQDTRAIAPGRSVYAAAVAVKGKILSDLHVHARAESLLLVFPSSQAAELTAHLDRFIVMEDVTLCPLDAAVLALCGPAAGAPDLGERYETARLGAAGFDVVVEAPRAEAARAALAALADRGEVVPVSEEAWEAARVQAGVPRFGVDFGNANFVQEAAITPRAVSFNKGCYLGQEVVCRLEMRGHVQKLLLRLRVDGEVPAVGDAVRAEGGEVGVVTSAAAAPGGGAALAMVRYAAAEKPLELCGRAAVTLPVYGA
ncbi:MAG: folate-binding protein YgfZ [Polyangiales bacterium]